MAIFKIFIEDKGNEENFIKEFSSFVLGDIYKDHKIDIINVNGWTKLKFVKNLFEENTDQGGINIIIFDADDAVKAPENGGFELRMAAIQEILFGYSFELFLFPDNKSDGDFESLLEKIINQNHSILLTCFESYELCISSAINAQGEHIYKTPIRKSKLFSYIDAFPKSRKQSEKFKNGDWFFSNPEIWDLNCDELNNLRLFLNRVLSD